jgi:Mg-chelatase subunit ChlI
MNVVDFPNLAPSVCVVCESVPPGASFVDTGRTFDPSAFTHLNGRKYLCESCVTDAANALDLFEEVKAPLEATVENLNAHVAQLQSDVENYSAIQNALEALNSRPVVQTVDVEQVAEQAKAKRTTRRKAAETAQKTVADETAAAEEGAKRQAEMDAQFEAERAAKAAAAAAAPVDPQPEPGSASANPEIEVSNPAPGEPPKAGQVWNGAEWLDPPAGS